MKTSQLMLGDLVMYYGSVSRIDGLWQDIVHIEGEPEEQYADMQEIGSIPLTAEILEKNGFEKRGELGLMQKIYEEEGVRISANAYYINIYSKSSRETRVNLKPRQAYVHELQHALRLCGLDYIADNFKI